MSPRSRRPSPPDSLRVLAERQMAETAPLDLKSLTLDEIQAAIHELEVHRIELKIQNEQLSSLVVLSGPQQLKHLILNSIFSL